MFRRKWLLAAMYLVFWLALPAAASAHASLVRSEPADVCGPEAVPRLTSGDPRCQTGLVLDQAPTVVRVTFSEPVLVAGRGIRVLSPSGKAVQRGKAAAEGNQASVDVDAMEPGTYVVDWQVTSSDTHPARGQFAFSVGQPSARPAGVSADVGQVTPLGLALQVLGRWLHFAGFALGFGTIGVSLLLSRWAPGMVLAARPLWRLETAGILLLLAAEPLALFGQTASLGTDQMLDGEAIGDALASPFGRLLAFRVAAALLLWVIGGSLYQEPRSMAEGDRFARDAAYPSIGQPLGIGAAIGLGVVLAIIDGLGQHAASFQPAWLGLLVHAVHLLGMALWLASVAVLLAEWRGRTDPEPPATAAEHNRKLPRLDALGKTAAVGLAALAASGLAMAVVHIPEPGALLANAYGQALAGKQVLLGAAVSLGWLALRGRGRGIRWAEVSVLGLAIGVAGLLVSLPPPR